jgi:hypothetical protein
MIWFTNYKPATATSQKRSMISDESRYHLYFLPSSFTSPLPGVFAYSSPLMSSLTLQRDALDVMKAVAEEHELDFS